jgi:hypothetical protein
VIVQGNFDYMNDFQNAFLVPPLFYQDLIDMLIADPKRASYKANARVRAYRINQSIMPTH